MGRRGQWERGFPLVSLTQCQRYRADGVLAPGEAAAYATNKVVPQNLSILSLFPTGEQGHFLFSGGAAIMKNPGKRW